jgi:hypothetical protein
VWGKCWPYLKNCHWTRIRMNINDVSESDIEPHRDGFESELTLVSLTHRQPHCTPPNAGWRLLLSSLQSTQWGLILLHCELYLPLSPWAADNSGRSSSYNDLVSFLDSWMSGDWSSRTDKAGRTFDSVMILDWSVDHEQSQEVWARSSIGSNHWCCLTHRPSSECGC